MAEVAVKNMMPGLKKSQKTKQLLKSQENKHTSKSQKVQKTNNKK